MPVPAWNDEFDLPYGSSVSDIQNYFEYIKNIKL